MSSSGIHVRLRAREKYLDMNRLFPEDLTQVQPSCAVRVRPVNSAQRRIDSYVSSISHVKAFNVAKTSATIHATLASTPQTQNVTGSETSPRHEREMKPCCTSGAWLDVLWEPSTSGN